MRKMSLCFLLNARTFCFKHLCVLSQTPLCFALNAFVFCFKRLCVLLEMSLCLGLNVLVSGGKRPCVFSDKPGVPGRGLFGLFFTRFGVRACIPKRAALHVKAFFPFPAVTGRGGIFCTDDFTPLCFLRYAIV